MADKWNWKALALTGAVLGGVYLFLAAVFMMQGVEFWWFNGPVWEFLVVAYPGLAATVGGAVVGLVLGAVCGGICGTLVAVLYNWANKKWK